MREQGPLLMNQNFPWATSILITVTTVLNWANQFFSFQQMSLKGSSSSLIEGLAPSFKNFESLKFKLLWHSFFFPTPFIIFLDGSPIGKLLTIHWGRFLECLLSKPGLMPQSLSSEVSDVRTAHHDRWVKIESSLTLLDLCLSSLAWHSIM